MEFPARMEMDEQGNHRIAAYGQCGEWARYEGISALQTSEGLYIAVTQYFEGTLPTERVLIVNEVNGNMGLVLIVTK